MGNNRKFEELEAKIQGLITSHQHLKAENETLKNDILGLSKSLEAEKARTKWVEDGYNSLTDAENLKRDKSIQQLQRRLENVISEVDKSLSLIDTNK